MLPGVPSAPAAPLPLRFSIEPYGLTEATVERARQGVLESEEVQEHLVNSTRYSVLNISALTPPGKPGRRRRALTPAERTFRATIYDYTQNRALIATGEFADPGQARAEVSDAQPVPSWEEFQAAVAILEGHEFFGPRIAAADLVPYEAMPGVAPREEEPERTLYVGLAPESEQSDHEIVGVNMVDESVTRYEDGAPPGTVSSDTLCGLPNEERYSTAQGTPGQALVKVFQGGKELWRFLVLRPSASSAYHGSGVELRNVDYRERRVLYRAHAPIVNVQYVDDRSGPWRDWQWEEGSFFASGAPDPSGVQVVTGASTAVTNGSDSGNFMGVAVFAVGQEIRVVSELRSDWYRYQSEFRLHADGTIKPRWGFTAVDNPAVCYRHRHHVLWRFDFDIETAGNNRVREFVRSTVRRPRYVTRKTEVRRFRSSSGHRWLIQNASSGRGYKVIPGPTDGTSDAFGRGDYWALRYRASELDDGHRGPPSFDPRANLATYVNDESLHEADVVLWYAAHFTHDVLGTPEEASGHFVGPTLRPVNW